MPVEHVPLLDMSQRRKDSDEVDDWLPVSAEDGDEDFDHNVVLALPEGTLDPVYEAKAQLLNNAIQTIGMGRYQWQLFVVLGFGWAADNMWPVITSLITVPITNEFNVSRPPLLSLAQNIGLLIGAVFWGFGCDIFGRKWAFNFTIGITAVFGLLSAGSGNFMAISAFAALWSLGVGGNLPVDSAIFLEFLPGTHQYLLTVLSVFWAFAQVLTNLVAWPLLSYMTCQEDTTDCTRSENVGWRYFMLAMGGFQMAMFITRFFLFTIYESPKFLMGKGRDDEAVDVVHEVARRNGRTTNLTKAQLREIGGPIRTDAREAISRQLELVDLSHVRALFVTPKMALSTSLIICIWALLGLAFPLYAAFMPYILASRGAAFGDGDTHSTYRNTLIIAATGIPGALLGGVFVEMPRLGRKGTLGIATALTGLFLFGSTTASSSTALLLWNCAFTFVSNIMYAVLYAYTPEVFPTKDRGTGNALTGMANRIFGIMAPIIAMFADLETAVPVYVSGLLFLVGAVLVMLLPFESRGKASL